MTRPCCNRGPMHWRKDQTILDLTLADYFDHRSFPDATRREVLAWWAISGYTEPHITPGKSALNGETRDGLALESRGTELYLCRGRTGYDHRRRPRQRGQSDPVRPGRAADR